MKLTKEGMEEMAANGYITTSDGRRLGPNGENIDAKPIDFRNIVTGGQESPWHHRRADELVDGMTPQEWHAANSGNTFQPGQSFDNANRFVMENLAGLATTGTASLNVAESIKLQSRGGMIKQAFNDSPDDADDLPVGPGQTYLTHLFKYNGVDKKLKDMKKNLNNGVNIYTDQSEALMTALNIVGLYSDKNPGGMPIDVQEALKLKFGNQDVDDVRKAEFMSIAEQGDSKIDPKRIRKFVNYDGSLTWEVLNEDKTVMSRFTMGKYNGTSIFAQGGYKKFAELLKSAKSKLGKDNGGEFDSIRSMFGGGQ